MNSINQLIQILEDFKANPEQDMKKLKETSNAFSKVAIGIRSQLDPTAKFLLTIMDQEFTGTTLDPQKSFDATELIFAADAYGRFVYL